MTEIDLEVKQSDGKTPYNEAFRLYRMVMRLETDLQIDKMRACELYERIVACIGRFDDDLKVYLKLEAIEAVLTCPKCNATGIQPVTDGTYVGESYIVTHVLKHRCKCCGG